MAGPTPRLSDPGGLCGLRTAFLTSGTDAIGPGNRLWEPLLYSFCHFLFPSLLHPSHPRSSPWLSPFIPSRAWLIGWRKTPLLSSQASFPPFLPGTCTAISSPQNPRLCRASTFPVPFSAAERVCFIQVFKQYYANYVKLMCNTPE